jgi:glycosyltransferase involved in cell wall biosynthesis
MYLHRTGVPLQESGHRVIVAALAGGQVEEKCRQSGLATVGISPGLSTGLGIPHLAGTIRDRQVDVIHVHKSSDLGRVLLARNLAGRGEMIFTEHMGGRRPKRDPYHTWIYRNVNTVLSISEDVRHRNLKALPITSEQSQVLYGGVDLDAYDPALYAPRQETLRERFDLPLDAILVGQVGRISRPKGHATLLQAATLLAPDHPDAHFVLIGDGSGAHGGEPEVLAELEEAARTPPLQGRVHFTGYTSEVPEVTSTLDISTLCSENEAFGLTVIESMALEKPVVATRAGALPEIVEEGQTGYLFAPLEAKELAQKLAPLIASRELRLRIGKAARQEALERFSMKRHIEQLEQVYRRALAPSKDQPHL